MISIGCRGLWSMLYIFMRSSSVSTFWLQTRSSNQYWRTASFGSDGSSRASPWEWCSLPLLWIIPLVTRHHNTNRHKLLGDKNSIFTFWLCFFIRDTLVFFVSLTVPWSLWPNPGNSQFSSVEPAPASSKAGCQACMPVEGRHTCYPAGSCRQTGFRGNQRSWHTQDPI